MDKAVTSADSISQGFEMEHPMLTTFGLISFVHFVGRYLEIVEPPCDHGFSLITSTPLYPRSDAQNFQLTYSVVSDLFRQMAPRLLGV